MTTLTGQCLCGKVDFKAIGDVLRVSACYCGMCRKQNGGGAFHGAEIKGDLSIKQTSSLIWYDASSKARRGFCGDCGSSLFWQSKVHESYFDVSLGALDENINLALTAHIFVDNCAAYQTIPTNAPHLTEADVLNTPLQDN